MTIKTIIIGLIIRKRIEALEVMMDKHKQNTTSITSTTVKKMQYCYEESNQKDKYQKGCQNDNKIKKQNNKIINKTNLNIKYNHKIE